jgi:hypothetical protein
MGIGNKLKGSPTQYALEIVLNAVAQPGKSKHFLQWTIGANQQKGPLAHNFHELANNIKVVLRTVEVDCL